MSSSARRNSHPPNAAGPSGATARPVAVQKSGSSASLRSQSSSAPTHHVAAIQNNPRPSIFSVISGDEYESWYEMATDFTTPASSASSFAPSLDPSSAEARALNEASLAEFGSYLKTVGEPYSQFAANRREPVPEQAGKAREGEPAGGAVRQTIAPVTAQPVSLEEVPEVLFDENFRLEDPETFAFFSPEGTPASTMVLQERLTHYLDLVEVNLLHAVSTRSEDFYTALGSWQELTEEVKRGCEQIDRLRAHVGAIDQRLARTALRLPFLGRKRSNQLRLHKKLSLLATIRKAQPTIQALLLAEDFVGALELISSTQAVLRDELAGVRCFMHLDEQLAETAAMLSRLMTQEFMRTMLPRLVTDVDGADGGGADSGGGAAPARAAGTDAAGKPLSLDALGARITPLLIGLVRQRVAAECLSGYFAKLQAELKGLVKFCVSAGLSEQRSISKAESGGGGGGADGAARPTELSAAAVGAARALTDEADASGAAGTIADQLSALSTEQFIAVLGGVEGALIAELERAAVACDALKVIVEGRRKLRGAAEARARGAGAARAKENGDVPADAADADAEAAPPAAAANGGSGAERAPAAAAAADASAAAAQDASDGELDTALLASATREFGAACETAAERFAKLLGARVDVHVRAALGDFVSTHRAALRFATTVERLGGEPCASLRSTLAAQARAFADNSHDATKQKLQSTLDCERWAQAEVHPRFQAIADAIVETSTAADEAAALTLGERADSASGKPAPAIVVDGSPFRTVGSALLLVELLGHYVQLARLFPAIAIHLLPQLVDALALFNSRSCTLVLGAQAIQLVGLARISSKILALLSQSLGLCIALMPHIRAHLAIQLPTKHHGMLSQLDRVLHDYREHQKKVFAKLVSIMLDRVDNSDGMQAALSGAVAVMPGQPSQYMTELVKDAQNLHRVLLPILTREQMEDVYSQILAGFDTKLVSIYSSTNYSDQRVSHRITTDIAHLITSMMQLQPDSTQLCCPQLAKFAQNISGGAG